MKKIMIIVGLLGILVLTGCTMQKDDIYNFFFNGGEPASYATNCSYITNISLNTTNCGTPKRALFVTYNQTWNELCCTFDTRCQAASNVNVSLMCNNINSTYTYVGPIFVPQTSVSGNICCNGGGQCYIDQVDTCNSTNSTQMIATTAFNLSGSSQWDAICCLNGGIFG